MTVRFDLCSGAKRRDLLKVIMKPLIGDKEIIIGLQVDPELCRGPEISPEPERGVSRNIPLPPNDFFHPIAWDQQRLRERTRTHVVVGEKIFPQDFARMNRTDIGLFHHFTPSMVIDDFDVIGITGSPGKTDTPLVVYPDTVLAAAIPVKRFQAIGWRDAKILQHNGRIQLCQTSPRPRENIGRKSFLRLSRTNGVDPLISQRLYHVRRVSREDTFVKWPYSPRIQSSSRAAP